MDRAELKEKTESNGNERQERELKKAKKNRRWAEIVGLHCFVIWLYVYCI